MKKLLWLIPLISILAFIALPFAVQGANDKYDYYSSGRDSASGPWGAEFFAQTVTASATFSLNVVRLNLYSNGTVNNYNIYCKIYATTGGNPTGAALSTGQVSDASLSTSNSSWVTFVMSTTVVINTSTVYAIVVSMPNAPSSYVYWGRDDTSPGYTGGEYKYSANSGSTWSGNSARDHLFETWHYDSTVGIITGDKTTVQTNASGEADAGTYDGQSQKLNGTLLNMGKASKVSCGFEIGETTSFGNIFMTYTLEKPGDFYYNIGHLKASTLYYFRAVAYGDVRAVGSTLSFTTSAGSAPTDPIGETAGQAPTVITGSATDITSTTAILHGEVTVTGNTWVSYVAFQIGKTTSYEMGFLPVGNAAGMPTFSYNVDNLEPDTTYHFRATATAGEVGNGSDGTFKTLKAGSNGSNDNNPIGYIDSILPSGWGGAAGHWIITLALIFLVVILGYVVMKSTGIAVFLGLGVLGLALVTGWLDWWVIIPIGMAAGLFAYGKVFRPGSG